MSNTIFPATPVNQNQINQTGALDALMIEQFTGEVEHTFKAESVLTQFFPTKPVKGTNTLTKKAIGKTKLQKLQRGNAPDGTTVDFSKASVTVDTTILSRHVFDEIETIQTDIDARKEITLEQGGELAEFKDQSIAIMAAKAAEYTNSAYFKNGKNPEGHFGATTVQFAAALDENDPAKLYAKIGELFAQMEEKKVNPRKAGIVLIMRPTTFYTLQQAEQIVNGDYLTSQGNKLSDIPMFKAWGVPVISTTNMPNTVITGHKLSNADNGDAYDGDFTDLVVLAVGPKALMIGETLPLRTDVWYDKGSKSWFVDSWFSFGVAPDRVEHAGRIIKA
jgi:hypothetical protein